jgi:hypothetical protein
MSSDADTIAGLRASNYDLRTVTLSQVRCLCEQFHWYASAGAAAVYCFGVWEGNAIVAAYAWQPPPPGAARAVCPEAPHGVLALSRMVAVPRRNRKLNHVSRPLRRQMKRLIDRTRWPVLVTYSDQGCGHTGHVYKCSGWRATKKEKRPFFLDDKGRRVSSYSNGRHGSRSLTRGGTTVLQRWEHWMCKRGMAAEWLASHGWHRVPVPGKRWRSGNQAFTYVRDTSLPLFEAG